MAIPSRTVFDPILVADLISKVRGKSSLARLSNQVPVDFVGNKEYTFSLDKEVDIVAENGAKTHGGVTVAPKTIIPIKFEYGARISDEFMYAAEEQRVKILEAFNDGFAKKLARGLDMAAINGINPRTGAASAVVGDNYIMYGGNFVEQTGTADAAIEAAIAAVEANDYSTTGIIIDTTIRGELAAERTSDGAKLYPEFAFGAKPETLGGQMLEVNNSVHYETEEDGITATVHGVVGDFENMFKWGYGKNITLEVIEYGNPDNSDAGDLKGHNQVYLRAEAYIGWAVLDESAFMGIATLETLNS